MRVGLICHPDHVSTTVQSVSVKIEPAPYGWTIWYEVEAITANIVIPSPAPSRRRDGLWESTCFEAFLKRPAAIGYFEFNLSTSTEWAAYAFQSYRAGRRDFDIAHPPIVSVIEQAAALDVHVTLPVEPGPWLAAFSAVIEEVNGSKSYWAVAHPPGDPDFHHDAGFTLNLPKG